MAADAGGIEYTIDADTKGAVDGIKEVEAENLKAGKSFDMLDKKVDEFNSSVKKSGRSINNLGQVMNKNGTINKKLTNEYKKLNDQLKMTRNNAKAANDSFGSVGRGAGQAGIQVQQFVGQLQGGQDAMLALSQQGADLGFVLGAPMIGALVGIGASVAGLALHFLGANKALEDFLETVDELNAEELAALGGEKQIQALKAFADESKSLREEMAKLIEEEKRLAVQTESLDSKLKQGIKTEEQFTGTGVGMGKSIVDLETRFEALNEQLITNRVRQQDINQELTTIAEKTDIASKKTNIHQEAIDEETKALEAQADALRLTAVQLAEKTKAEAIAAFEAKNATAAEIERLTVAYDYVIEATKIAEADKARADAARESAAAARQAAKDEADTLRAMREEVRALDEERKKADDAERARNQALRSAASVSPALAIEVGEDSAMSKLQEARAQDLISEQEYQTQKTAIAAQAEEQRMALMEERFRSESMANDLILDSLDQLGQASQQAIEGLLTGTLDAEDALRSLASSILSNLVGALVDVGVQHVKNAIIGKTAAASSAAAGVATAGTLATAYAPAAAMASLASFGANSVPASAGIASTVALSQGLAVVGGLESGGAMKSNSLYQLGESNQPEVLQTSKGMFGISGDGGKVFNRRQLDQIDGGGGGVNVQVNNEPGVVSTVISETEKNIIIESAVNLSENNYADQMQNRNGKMYRANRGAYGQPRGNNAQ